MSDYNIPSFDIQIEIMKRLPIKSLMKFRLVSKQWKSVIHTSQFISDYNNHAHDHDDDQKLLVRFFNKKYVYIVDDDDSSPQHKFPLTLPLSSKPSISDWIMIGYSQGLFAFYNYDVYSTDKRVAVIWNPSIRKSVDIPIPHVLKFPYDTVVGFGVCNATDPMIVKINYYFGDESGSIPGGQVEVLKLSTGAWRTLSNPPRKSLDLTKKVVVIDQFIYWFAVDRARVIDRFHSKTLLLSFDMTTEEFTEILLPHSLAKHSLYKLKESLVLLETIKRKKILKHGVWMMVMEHGVQNSFEKLYVIEAPNTSIRRVLGFGKNGQPIIEMDNDDDEQAVFVYKPESKQLNDIGISGNGSLCLASSYTGTLLLLDQ